MKLWGGRFTKETNQLVHNFNASISYDQKFYKQDILGSIAHVTMLEKQGILTTSEKDAIVDGLQGILNDLESGALEITAEHEDIHSFVEANLIERIGDPGKKLHTGRSRNRTARQNAPTNKKYHYSTKDNSKKAKKANRTLLFYTDYGPQTTVTGSKKKGPNLRRSRPERGARRGSGTETPYPPIFGRQAFFPRVRLRMSRKIATFAAI